MCVNEIQDACFVPVDLVTIALYFIHFYMEKELNGHDKACLVSCFYLFFSPLSFSAHPYHVRRTFADGMSMHT